MKHNSTETIYVILQDGKYLFNGIDVNNDLPFTEMEFDVDFIGDLCQEESGIGSYEFWGCKGYDDGETYFVLEELKWDKEKHTKEENDAIKAYIADDANWEKIEESFTKSISNETRIIRSIRTAHHARCIH